MPDPDPKIDRTQKTPSRSATGPLGDARTGTWMPADPVPAAAAPPERIGRYEVRAVLGQGAFGRVCRGFDPELHREVAIKVPLREGLTPEMRDRFLVEARAAATVHHPNVCPIHDVGTDGDLPYMVMHLVAGPTLAGVLAKRQTPLPPRHAAAVARKLALGVAAAHAKGVIHRDLKPHNVLVDEARWEVMVTDFGLARIGDQGSQTRKGEVMGTPAYMAPEQARGEVATVGPLSDVYSLGVILFQLLTSRVPYTGSVYEVMYQHCHADPRPPSSVLPGLDPRLDAICLKAMAKQPADRYPSAKAFADALADYLRGGERADASARAPTREVFTLDPEPPPPAPPPSDRSRTATETRGGSGTLRAVPPEPEVGVELVELVELPPAARSRARRPAPYQWALLGAGLLVLVVGATFAVRAMVGTKPKADAEAPAPPSEPARVGQGVTDPRGNAFRAGDVYALRYGDPAVEMRFRWVPPGQFARGSATGGHTDEQPVRPVTITKGFWMAETECTQDQWQAVRTGDPNPSTFTGPQRPVERVSATEADDFCATLARLTGRPVRLPTEAEWEYACRAGTTTDFAFGDALATTRANFDGTKSEGAGEQFRNRTTDAGSFPANAWGLRDMHGNVWEWCQDGYDADFYARAPSLDPLCTDNQGRQRVLRGGSWYDRASYCRSAYRSRFSPGGRDSSYGFRACFRPD